MKRVRKTAAAPAKADLPFERKGRGKIRPNDTWTLLRVKMWRLQQNVAARLRRSVKNWKRVLAQYRDALDSLPNKDRSQVASLASFTVNGHMQLRLRFVPGSSEDEAVVSRGGLSGPGGPTLRSTLGRRIAYAARTVVRDFGRSLVTTTLGIVGQRCLLCGSLFHSAFGCLEAFERTFFLEADHIESAITRMRDVSIREEDWSDDYVRIGVARLAMRKAQDARLIGFLFWFSVLARRCASLGGAGMVLNLLRYPVLANALWRVLTGSDVLPEPPRTRLLLHRIWGSEGLFDFAAQELNRRRMADQYPGPGTDGQATSSVVLASSTGNGLDQEVQEDTVYSVAASMVLVKLWETQLRITDLKAYCQAQLFSSTFWDYGYEQFVATPQDRRDTVCDWCHRRAWKGSTCAGCQGMKRRVRSVDSRLWETPSSYSESWVDTLDDLSLQTIRRLLQSEVTLALELSDMMSHF